MILDLSYHDLDVELRPVLDQPFVVGGGFSLQTLRVLFTQGEELGFTEP